ncbi:MAG: BON domain-containing protein [Pirellulales bacterium]|nr:BON domain-containing protein [Pirellulales bacterium]
MRHLSWAAALAALVLAMPLSAIANDQEVANQVAESLRSSGRMKDYKVGVKVQEGVAWLEGTVASPEQMRTAESIAEQCYGVDRVVNNLTIGSSRAVEQNGGGQRSGLLQPDSISRTHVNAAVRGRDRNVVRASMELPEHAQQELAVAGPAPQLQEDVPMAPPAAEPMPMAQLNPMAQPMPMPNRQAQPMPQAAGRRQMPLPIGARGPYQQVSRQVPGGEAIGTPSPMPMQGGAPIGMAAPAPLHYDSPSMPGYAWPSYAAYPNYAALTYPKQYSPTAWPYIGPFYPYPQVPLGWRKVTLEWDDGWWFLDFKDSH